VQWTWDRFYVSILCWCQARRYSLHPAGTDPILICPQGRTKVNHTWVRHEALQSVCLTVWLHLEFQYLDSNLRVVRKLYYQPLRWVAINPWYPWTVSICLNCHTCAYIHLRTLTLVLFVYFHGYLLEYVFCFYIYIWVRAIVKNILQISNHGLRNLQGRGSLFVAEIRQY